MNYCRRCGAALTHVKDHVYSCPNGHTLFANTSPASGVWLLNDKNEVLVATRGIEPGKGKLDSPGGFNDGAETSLDCATRELQEELGLAPGMYTPLEFFHEAIDEYQYQGETLPILTTIFIAHLIGNPVITPTDDVAAVAFMNLGDVNPDDIYLPAPRTAFLKLRDQLL